MQVLLLIVFVNFSFATFYQQSTSSKGFMTKCGTENMITACILRCNEYELDSSFNEETKTCCCVNTVKNSNDEKEIIPNADTENNRVNRAIVLLSENQPSSSSSTFRSSYNTIPGKAFDGGLDQRFVMRSCMHTKKDKPAWLQVDLLMAAIISYVRIYNRNDDAIVFNRLKDATISVGNEKTWSNMKETKICQRFRKIENILQIETFYCPTKIIGRFVRLSIKEGFLHICEMQVYGYYA